MQNLAHPSPSPRPRDAGPGLRRPEVGRVDSLLARAVLRYLRGVAHAMQMRWVDGLGNPLAATDIAARLVSLSRRSQPLVMTYYIEDALGVATLALLDAEFLTLMRSLRCVVDDTVAGRVSGVIIERLGGRYAVLPCAGHPDRVRGVYDIIRAGEPCSFPVDGGGPYRQVGTGVIGLAASLHAAILPLAVRLTRSMTFAPQSKVRVPVRGSRLIAAMGDPIRIMRGTDRHAATTALKHALDRLSLTVDTFA